jgi:mevalonate kinase
MTKKLDKEDLNLIQNIQENFAKNYNALGNITTEQHILKQEKLHYLNEFENLRKQEQELLSKLKEKYGDGQININDGTFTSM